jgi:hypothetical protein
MEVSDQPHTLTTLLPTEQEARWALDVLWAFWKRDEPLAPASIQGSQTIQSKV